MEKRDEQVSLQSKNMNIIVKWARSSGGRAPRSQRGGRGFDSHRVHSFLFYMFRKENKMRVWE